MFNEILRYGFLAIFFITAILGLASIPDSGIKIPEWYRKRIFTALILEVVGALIILFNQEFINKDSSGVPVYKINTTDWVALTDSCKLAKPVITIATADTAINVPLGKQSNLEFKGLKAEISKNGLSIKNANDATIGMIPGMDLESFGLFNSFRTAKDEISSSENYSYIKWSKCDTTTCVWEQKGSFIGPFRLEVYDGPNGIGTNYRIINIKDNSSKFDSNTTSKDLFAVDNRIIHFLEYENVYYLLRIAWADLTEEQQNKYVHVINVRMKPSFAGKKNTP